MAKVVSVLVVGFDNKKNTVKFQIENSSDSDKNTLFTNYDGELKFQVDAKGIKNIQKAIFNHLDNLKSEPKEHEILEAQL